MECKNEKTCAFGGIILAKTPFYSYLTLAISPHSGWYSENIFIFAQQSRNMNKSAIITRNDRYTRRVEQLLSAMESFSEANLNQKPADGGWSAIQTIHHLLLTEELSMAYIRKKLSFQPALSAAGPGAIWRGFLLWAYLSTPFKFKAPKNVGDENLPVYASLADTRIRWQNARTAWSDFLKNMPEEMAAQAIYKHPRAGRLGWAQMLSFFETHFKRHHKQIIKALQAS